jgi:hypothetical protein
MTSPKRPNRRQPHRLDPPPVRITNEEILADLLYPARSIWAAQPQHSRLGSATRR